MTGKRIIIVVVIVALILAIGAGVLTYLAVNSQQKNGRVPFFGNLPFIGGGRPTPAPPAPTPPGPTGEPSGPAAEARPLRQIIDQDILAPALSAGGKSILYIRRENGHVQSSDLNGENVKDVLSLTVLEAFEAAWAPARNRVAIFYREGDAVKKFLAGVATGTASRFLPPEATSASFSPDGKSLAYLLRRPGDTALVIADAGNQKPAVVYTTPIPDFTLAWISKNSILLVSRPSGLAPSLVLRFDVPTKKTEVLLSGTHGVVVQPLPNGNGFFYSRSQENGAAERISRYTLASRASDPFDLVTIAEKCAAAADAKKLYCGVPQGTILSPSPDEWYKGATSFLDAIVELDLATKQAKTLIAPGGPGGPFDVISPFLSPDGKYLFFQDKKDNTLWRLTLKE